MPFRVFDLDNGNEEAVGMAEVLGIINMAANYDPDLPEPALDPDCDLCMVPHPEEGCDPPNQDEINAWRDGNPALRGYF